MKTSLFAAAAVVLFASQAQAADIVSAGHVGANFGISNLDIPGPNLDVENYQLEGAAKFDVGSMSALLDTAVTATGGDDVEDNVDYSVTAHLTGKLGNSLVGGFGGVNTTTDLTVWSLGVEGQTALTDAVTLYGQAGWGDSEQLDATLWAVRGELRYFPNENLKLQGSAGWAKADTDFGDVDAWTVGAEAEYQFAGTPWSVLAGYDYGDSNDADIKSHTFKIGGRYTFGGQTLKARDASGADLGSVRKLFTGIGGF